MPFGGLDTLSPGQIVLTPPNPIEVAQKLADLAKTQQEPELARAQLAIAQAASRRGEAQLAEDVRYHTGTLAEQTAGREASTAAEAARLGEETRYHTGTLEETRAGRESTAKTNVIGDIMSHLSPLEQAGLLPKNTMAETLAKFGYPELSDTVKKLNAGKLTAAVSSQLPAIRAQTDPTKREAQITGIPDPDVQAGVRSALATPDVTKPPVTETPATDYPGVNLGSVGRSIAHAPLGLQNILSTAYNVGGLPVVNTLNSAFGIPAQRRLPMLPQDYGEAFKMIQGGMRTPAPVAPPITVAPPPPAPAATPPGLDPRFVYSGQPAPLPTTFVNQPRRVTRPLAQQLQDARRTLGY